MKRRDFMAKTLAVSSSLYFPSTLAAAKNSNSSPVVKVQGESPYNITKRVIEGLGGMKKFVSNQDIVMIKPNIGWNRTVEQGACTNPEVLKAIIEEALNSGAKKVIVMDHPCHKAADTYRRSGIQAMSRKAGAEVRFTDDNRLVIYNFKGEHITRWPVYKDFLEVDKFINVPILKHHGSAGLTIGMKNLYGILGGRRGKLHRDMGASIADLAQGFKTHLTIVDAFRVLKRNGPVGGRLSDVELKKTVLASSNIMEVDVVATTVFGSDPLQISFLQEGAKRNIGQIDLSKIPVKELTA
jgi:uncharacterized protein (DUF362 family)